MPAKTVQTMPRPGDPLEKLLIAKSPLIPEQARLNFGLLKKLIALTT
jgi:hypothetical protein